METSVLEILVKGAPESLLAVLCVYFFCGIKPEPRQLVIVWLIHMLVAFVTRTLLPGYGMTLLITVVLLVVIFNVFLKIQMSKVINGALLCILFVIIAEAINFLFIQLFCPEKLELILNDSSTRIIYTIPSTVLLALQVFAVYYFSFIRKKNNDV